MSSRKNESEQCDVCKKRERSDKEMQALMNRLNRVEGQIRGIKKMVEEERYCIDILTQVAAANAALNSFTRSLLSQHIRTCVAQELQKGSDESVEELVRAIQKLMK